MQGEEEIPARLESLVDPAWKSKATGLTRHVILAGLVSVYKGKLKLMAATGKPLEALQTKDLLHMLWRHSSARAQENEQKTFHCHLPLHAWMATEAGELLNTETLEVLKAWCQHYWDVDIRVVVTWKKMNDGWGWTESEAPKLRLPVQLEMTDGSKLTLTIDQAVQRAKSSATLTLTIDQAIQWAQQAISQKSERVAYGVEMDIPNKVQEVDFAKLNLASMFYDDSDGEWSASVDSANDDDDAGEWFYRVLGVQTHTAESCMHCDCD
jgi:hypothetical protein